MPENQSQIKTQQRIGTVLYFKMVINYNGYADNPRQQMQKMCKHNHHKHRGGYFALRASEK